MWILSKIGAVCFHNTFFFFFLTNSVWTAATQFKPRKNLTHQLHLHRQQWLFSICKTVQCPTQLGLWTCIQDGDLCRSCLCCPPMGVSIVSGCEGLLGRYKLTAPHWQMSCERAQIRHRHPEPADHRLQNKLEQIRHDKM